MFSILGNKSRVAGVVPRLPSETGVQGSIPLAGGLVIIFFIVRLVRNPTSDSKRNEEAKGAYKCYPH